MTAMMGMGVLSVSTHVPPPQQVPATSMETVGMMELASVTLVGLEKHALIVLRDSMEMFAMVYASTKLPQTGTAVCASRVMPLKTAPSAVPVLGVPVMTGPKTMVPACALMDTLVSIVRSCALAPTPERFATSMAHVYPLVTAFVMIPISRVTGMVMAALSARIHGLDPIAIPLAHGLITFPAMTVVSATLRQYHVHVLRTQPMGSGTILLARLVLMDGGDLPVTHRALVVHVIPATAMGNVLMASLAQVFVNVTMARMVMASGKVWNVTTANPHIMALSVLHSARMARMKCAEVLPLLAVAVASAMTADLEVENVHVQLAGVVAPAKTVHMVTMAQNASAPVLDFWQMIFAQATVCAWEASLVTALVFVTKALLDRFVTSNALLGYSFPLAVTPANAGALVSECVMMVQKVMVPVIAIRHPTGPSMILLGTGSWISTHSHVTSANLAGQAMSATFLAVVVLTNLAMARASARVAGMVMALAGVQPQALVQMRCPFMWVMPVKSSALVGQRAHAVFMAYVNQMAYAGAIETLCSKACGKESCVIDVSLAGQVHSAPSLVLARTSPKVCAVAMANALMGSAFVTLATALLHQPLL